MNPPVLLVVTLFVGGLHLSGPAKELLPYSDAMPGQDAEPGANAPPPNNKPSAAPGQPPQAKKPAAPPAGGAGSEANATPETPTPKPSEAEAPRLGGQGHPAIAVSPTSAMATARVQVTLEKEVDGPAADFQAGLLVTPQHPDQRIIPKVSVLTDLRDKKGLQVGLDVAVSGLVPFGDMTVPLMYKGRQIESLHFHKAGLILRAPVGSPISAYERDGQLLLVLENPSDEIHRSVGLRVRFQDADVCTFSSDQAVPAQPESSDESWWTWFARWIPRWLGGGAVDVPCANADSWARFVAPPGSQISLRVPTRREWFLDRLNFVARSTTRQGVITLRYFTEEDQPVSEHNLPLEVQFEPTSINLGWSIAWVGFLLLTGALIFLAIRVSIPNYRRKKAIKDSLNEVRAATATISNAVDTQLRVLLRVERLSLDERRREGWVLLPGFAELAARTEAGLATLTRKIALARRLDAATCRRQSLMESPVAPTRLDIIDRDLQAAGDALKRDLRDADWLFIQQRLEAADKALNEPSPEEKDAFEALLAQRWQLIRDHFGQIDGEVPNTKVLVIPPEIASMKDCFPRGSLLPRAGDDGRKWIDSIGTVRADLQLTALERLRDVQFLAPNPPSAEWLDAMKQLGEWLATPSIDNLAFAKRLLQQLSEATTVSEIVDALREGRAEIEMDPQLIGANQTVKLSVRFLDPRLNSANLRDAVQCEWRFDAAVMTDARARLRQNWPRVARIADTLVSVLPPGDPGGLPIQRERGWVVYRYFEPGVAQQTLEVTFLREGKELEIPAAIIHDRYRKTVNPREQTHQQKDGREKWLSFGFQTVQLLAALLVPLATLAITTAGDAASGRWWDLVGIGFGSEAIRNILTADQPPPTQGQG